MPRDYIFRIRGMVGKPPVELSVLSVCRTLHGISIADAIPKRLDQHSSCSSKESLRTWSSKEVFINLLLAPGAGPAPRR
jgi:hypothetical protein